MSVNQKVSFHIGGCTGEDLDYPARELLGGSAHGRGWQSPRFCSWPQELVIALDRPSTLSSIQVLCHEYKIPRFVTIFVSSMPCNSTDPSTAVERRLGHVRMDDNQRSSYQARELKTVQLDNISACSVRFVLDQCHVNEHNIYNQVGLMAINITGVPILQCFVARGVPFVWRRVCLLACVFQIPSLQASQFQGQPADITQPKMQSRSRAKCVIFSWSSKWIQRLQSGYISCTC